MNVKHKCKIPLHMHQKPADGNFIDLQMLKTYSKMFGLCGLKGHIVEIRLGVTLVHGQRTECEDRSRILEAEFAI